MPRMLIFALTVILILSCNEGKERVSPSLKTGERKAAHNHTNITFDFITQKTTEFPATIKIYGSLHNNNADTVYFLSSFCDGKKYSLQYDTAKFNLMSGVTCVTDYPYIEKIPPKGKLDLAADFENKNSNKEIKLGFDLYEVDKSFDLTKFDLSKIYNRSNNDKNIIWADIQNLK